MPEAFPFLQAVSSRSDYGDASQFTTDRGDAWREWADNNGHSKGRNKQVFGRDLRSALPKIKDGQIGPRGERHRVYVVKEISGPAEKAGKPTEDPGIGANIDTVKKELVEHPESFVSRTGEEAQEVGRSPKATVWQLTSGHKSVESVGDFQGGGGEPLT